MQIDEIKNVKPLLQQHNVSGSFTIIDWCKCKCGQEVSPNQCDSMAQILFSDDREYVVGFECWQCSEWIPFPKNCR
jgi:hypothetical protein